MTIALIVVAVLVVIVALMYNALVRARVRVENAWAQIDVQLKRRIDLIPNLVETVKGYASHEQKTLDAVIQARNAASSAAASPAAQAQASDALSGALRQLFALSEAYPDLKANQNFLALQEELAATEGRVAYARDAFDGLHLMDRITGNGFDDYLAAVQSKRAGKSRNTARTRRSSARTASVWACSWLALTSCRCRTCGAGGEASW